jgi:hypothetical protein
MLVIARLENGGLFDFAWDEMDENLLYWPKVARHFLTLTLIVAVVVGGIGAYRENGVFLYLYSWYKVMFACA